MAIPNIMLRMLRSAFVLVIMAEALVLHAQSQTCGANAQATIATDRPQVTASSIVVPCGSLQFENGFLNTAAAGQQSYDFPETAIRFGVANKTELRIGVPDYFYNTATTSGFANGFGDLTLGFKQQLGPLHDFNLSFIPSLTLPTGADPISTHGYDASLQLPWSRALTNSWTVAGMFSVAWPTQSGQHNATGQASVYFDRQITATLDAWVEYSGSFPQRGGPQHIIDFGAAYKLTPHQQLDFRTSFGLSAATPDHTIGVGYSVRFQVIRPR